MSLIDRIRRFWSPSKLDHPLDEAEREEIERPQSAFDVRADVEQEYVGRDLDPDEPRSGHL